jgi:hypothetical protein
MICFTTLQRQDDQRVSRKILSPKIALGGPVVIAWKSQSVGDDSVAGACSTAATISSGWKVLPACEHVLARLCTALQNASTLAQQSLLAVNNHEDQ